MVMYANNEVETNKQKKNPEIKNQLQHKLYMSTFEKSPFASYIKCLKAIYKTT